MNWFDFAILGVIILSALISVTRGFMKEAVSLVIWFSALFIASQFYSEMSSYLTQITDPVLRNGASIAILFVATLLAGALVNYLISQLVKATGLTGTDRILGAVFGLFRGVLIVSAILFSMDTFTPLSAEEWWQTSLLVPEFAVIIEWFFDYVKDSSSFISPT